ncbi:hypothetical protein C0J52_00054 [Blattella germanica]|nr:hypothetical protein C0J52_00054 [Blattella germanica]
MKACWEGAYDDEKGGASASGAGRREMWPSVCAVTSREKEGCRMVILSRRDSGSPPGGCRGTDWDINDTSIPRVSEYNRWEEWADGHCRLVYPATSEEAKRHASGWAMRNTNNHNVHILKKSCLGVLVEVKAVRPVSHLEKPRKFLARFAVAGESPLASIEEIREGASSARYLRQGPQKAARQAVPEQAVRGPIGDPGLQRPLWLPSDALLASHGPRHFLPGQRSP